LLKVSGQLVSLTEYGPVHRPSPRCRSGRRGLRRSV